MNQLKLRRIILAITGVVFLLIAVASLVAPSTMAESIGYVLGSTTALNEFRAIYVGLWLAHALVCFWAAWRLDLVFLGDVVGILLLGQVLGRFISLLADGLPGASILPPAAAELIGAVLILALRQNHQSND